MTVKVYDANQVSMIFMGIPITSGYEDGEFLTIEQTMADFEVVTGTDGSVTRYRTNNRHATIKVKLMQSSSGNAALSVINTLDISTPGGAGIGPMLIRDRQGTSIYTASKCWVAKPPDVKFDRKPVAREWILECADLVRLDGGN
jgi:Protein of unknown function (DUF3277)